VIHEVEQDTVRTSSWRDWQPAEHEDPWQLVPWPATFNERAIRNHLKKLRKFLAFVQVARVVEIEDDDGFVAKLLASIKLVADALFNVKGHFIGHLTGHEKEDINVAVAEQHVNTSALAQSTRYVIDTDHLPG